MTNHSNLKNIGTLREKILFYLTENPNLNAQAIQKNLPYPDHQYPNILYAVKALEKSNLIKSKKAKSKKNIPIKLYQCTQNGILYTLARNTNANTITIFNAYKHENNTIEPLQKFYNIWGQTAFTQFIKDLNEFLPMIQKDGLESAIPHMLMKITTQVNILELDMPTKIKMVKETMKMFPLARQILKQWSKSINDAIMTDSNNTKLN